MNATFNPTIIVAVLVALVVGGLVVFLAMRRRRTTELQATYGPEYQRTVQQVGDRGRAEDELLRRRERVEKLHLRPLEPAQRERFREAWRGIQTRFVDDPQGAVQAAAGLVEQTMTERGYPMGDFDQQAADLSVHHARVVDNYRAARDIALRHQRGETTTEDLRQAMVYYRALFQDLLDEHPDAAAAASDDVARTDGRTARTADRAAAAADRTADRAAARTERTADRIDDEVRP